MVDAGLSARGIVNFVPLRHHALHTMSHSSCYALNFRNEALEESVVYPLLNDYSCAGDACLTRCHKGGKGGAISSYLQVGILEDQDGSLQIEFNTHLREVSLPILPCRPARR